MFLSLRTRNYRLFFVGQLVSVIGAWVHQIAETWLVWELTRSAVAVGFVTACRFVPLLLLGLWGGAVADRHDRRRVLVLTQASRGLAAAAVGVAALVDASSVGLVYGCAVVAGVANAVDNPARRAFVAELVPREQLLNAVSLTSSVMATSRVVAPLLGGALIATVGVAWCFLVNAVSYGAVLVALAAMDGAEIHKRPPLQQRRGAIRAGLRYARSEPTVFTTLVLVGVICACSWNWETLLAVHAARTFDGGAGTYALLFSSFSVGTLLGALGNAAQRQARLGRVVRGAGLVGVATTLVAVVPGLPVTVAALLGAGLVGAVFTTSSNAVLQTTADDAFHGRVMAMYSVLFIGTKGVGGAGTGAIAGALGPRWGIGVGGVCCLAVAAWAWPRVDGQAGADARAERDEAERDGSAPGAVHRNEADRDGAAPDRARREADGAGHEAASDGAGAASTSAMS
jgi:MFS family permease